MSTSPIQATITSVTGAFDKNSITEFDATANQTTFTVDYTVGEILVFKNGVLLDASAYTATNGTSVVLDTGADADDEITIDAGKLTLTTSTETSLASVDDATAWAIALG